ncbi:MAG: alpha/beta fold hydrolase [Bacteroidetes bacterium]|nr:alpha/beta fold hydrolase [Bacteroidota bacterium]
MQHPTDYRAPAVFRDPHVHTVWAARVRKVDPPGWQRQRVELPDGDFLDVDRLLGGHRQAVILLHGLEGSADRTYMRALARALHGTGRDVLAVNMRGCSGEPNRLPRSYHSGATEDLRAVIEAFSPDYDAFEAAGFSLGGNLLLKYLGEEGSNSHIQAAMAVSVPCDLAGSSEQLAGPGGRLYMWNFMRLLRRKVHQKAAAFPGVVSAEGVEDMRTFRAFDDAYTAPLHGYRDARHYWAECSSNRFLSGIRVPTLLINAADDPFLSPGCFPIDACRDSAHVDLEIPSTGGHVGFLQGGLFSGEPAWTELRAVAFFGPAT